MALNQTRRQAGGQQRIVQSLREVLDQIERCAELVGENQEAQALLDSAGDKLHAAIRGLRHGFSPLGEVPLDTCDLFDGLQALTTHARQAIGVPVHPMIDDAVCGALPTIQARHVLMIVREALANAILHAGARRMALRATVENERLIVRLSDDGRGFDLVEQRRRLPAKGGLALMQAHADAARGVLQVASVPGAGTIVTLTLPLASAGSRRSHAT